MDLPETFDELPTCPQRLAAGLRAMASARDLTLVPAGEVDRHDLVAAHLTVRLLLVACRCTQVRELTRCGAPAAAVLARALLRAAGAPSAWLSSADAETACPSLELAAEVDRAAAFVRHLAALEQLDAETIISRAACDLRAGTQLLAIAATAAALDAC
jgi:hypothetical protein